MTVVALTSATSNFNGHHMSSAPTMSMTTPTTTTTLSHRKHVHGNYHKMVPTTTTTSTTTPRPRNTLSFDESNIIAGADHSYSKTNKIATAARLNMGGIIALGVFGGFVFLAAVISIIVIIVRR